MPNYGSSASSFINFELFRKQQPQPSSGRTKTQASRKDFLRDQVNHKIRRLSTQVPSLFMQTKMPESEFILDSQKYRSDLSENGFPTDELTKNLNSLQETHFWHSFKLGV